MEKKTLLISLLSISAALLLIGNFMARAATTANSRDFQLVTARNQQGGESLYIVDNKTGQMAVFVWDSTSRTIRPQAIRPVADAFNQTPAR